MRTTRIQRKQFIKDWIKNNPSASKEQLLKVKKQMADLGKQQHIALSQHIESETGKLIENHVMLDELIDDDFAPDDLN